MRISVTFHLFFQGEEKLSLDKFMTKGIKKKKKLNCNKIPTKNKEEQYEKIIVLFV